MKISLITEILDAIIISRIYFLMKFDLTSVYLDHTVLNLEFINESLGRVDLSSPHFTEQKTKAQVEEVHPSLHERRNNAVTTALIPTVLH